MIEQKYFYSELDDVKLFDKLKSLLVNMVAKKINCGIGFRITLISFFIVLTYLLFFPRIASAELTSAILFAIALGYFLIPGLCIARRFEADINITYISLSFFISYVVFGILVVGLRIFGQGYNVFYCIHGIITILLLFWGFEVNHIFEQLIIPPLVLLS